MAYLIKLTNTDEQFPCAPVQTLLAAMEALGRKGIPVGCRGGGCGVCKVRVEAGQVHSERMSRACVSAEEAQQGLVLACRTHPDSDLTLTAVDKLSRCLQRSSQRSRADSFLTRALSAIPPNHTD